MSLGERLRQARLEKGLSQTQVAGETITRNMLSQLEHDQASPSVRTLEYLASVLGVRVSWLLEEQPAGADQKTDEARALFEAGQYSECLALLQQAPQLSPEGGLLLCRSALQDAAQALKLGNPCAAAQSAKLALSAESIYIGAQERLSAYLLLASCAMAREEPAESWMELVQAQSRELGFEEHRHLLAARYHLLGDRLQDAERELWSAGSFSPETKGEYLLLRGWLSVLKERYQDAILYLRQAEEDSLSGILQKLDLYRLLEISYREQEDYKMAYHYASLRLAAGSGKNVTAP